ncbi:11313_t:CDS:2 [Paraglomus brasilianum]|uniref:11313_t:CDS:1 n=1 Tax=Paraglomus brasilianum TaxID=144538 RepID=A0A9N9AY60_9GLOM|nr:11313_t:CDS:2 [Paraglomus brasilianum]
MYPDARQDATNANKEECRGLQEETAVYLNVYDMLPGSAVTAIGYWMGFGVFHTGVEVLGVEYNFGGHDYDASGVFRMKPRLGPPNVTYKESIFMGYTKFNKEDIVRMMDELSKEWKGNSYNLLLSEACRILVGKRAPSWINRAAKLGTLFPCVVPSGWIEPPECGEETEAIGNVKFIVLLVGHMYWLMSLTIFAANLASSISIAYTPYHISETQVLNPN